MGIRKKIKAIIESSLQIGNNGPVIKSTATGDIEIKDKTDANYIDFRAQEIKANKFEFDYTPEVHRAWLVQTTANTAAVGRTGGYANFECGPLYGQAFAQFKGNFTHSHTIGNGSGKTETISVIQTTNNTQTVIANLSVAEYDGVWIRGAVTGVGNNNIDISHHTIEALFFRPPSGNVSRKGISRLVEIKSDSSWDVDIIANTGLQTIDIVVIGAASATVTWKALWSYFKTRTSN
ncbi:hypothetical protein DRJ25_04460 [Candidatus Woesearchaeota archaeon]|nr:MAG: hypothetical protein DRJ25_04460 [Candidatus Woesearchaeota archaeon]